MPVTPTWISKRRLVALSPGRPTAIVAFVTLVVATAGVLDKGPDLLSAACDPFGVRCRPALSSLFGGLVHPRERARPTRARVSLPAPPAHERRAGRPLRAPHDAPAAVRGRAPATRARAPAREAPLRVPVGRAQPARPVDRQTPERSAPPRPGPGAPPPRAAATPPPAPAPTAQPASAPAAAATEPSPPSGEPAPLPPSEPSDPGLVGSAVQLLDDVTGSLLGGGE